MVMSMPEYSTAAAAVVFFSSKTTLLLPSPFFLEEFPSPSCEDGPSCLVVGPRNTNSPIPGQFAAAHFYRFLRSHPAKRKALARLVGQSDCIALLNSIIA